MIISAPSSLLLLLPVLLFFLYLLLNLRILKRYIYPSSSSSCSPFSLYPLHYHHLPSKIHHTQHPYFIIPSPFSPPLSPYASLPQILPLPFFFPRQCSSTCGEGVQMRVWECIGGGGNEVTYECGPQPRQERVCFRPPCPTSEHCLRDTSAFCQLPVLHRYCQLPKYRQLCCHTCANVVY